MRILAIETSGQRGSLATLCGEADAVTTVGQSLLPAEGRTARSLAPALESLLAAAGWKPKSVELVAVAVGPGSFTGLRIGVTTAKTFAYAVGADVIGVNTLAVLAQQVPPTSAQLWAVIDAQRSELFAARFSTTSTGDWVMSRETSVIAKSAWLAELRPDDCVTGPALRRLRSDLPSSIVAVAENLWQPTAEAVGQVAWRSYRRGDRDDVWMLLPKYYRLSAAEEKLS